MCSGDEPPGLPRSVNTAAGIDLVGRKSWLCLTTSKFSEAAWHATITTKEKRWNVTGMGFSVEAEKLVPCSDVLTWHHTSLNTFWQPFMVSNITASEYDCDYWSNLFTPDWHQEQLFTHLKENVNSARQMEFFLNPLDFTLAPIWWRACKKRWEREGKNLEG